MRGLGPARALAVSCALVLGMLAAVPVPAARATPRPPVPPIDYAMNVFDWTIGWTDYDLFTRMVDQLPDIGFTTVELGVPWDSVETRPGEYDFTEVDRRVAYVESKGLRLRLRVNVQDYPDWFQPVLLARPDGSTDLRNYGHRTGIPSFFDDPTTTVQRRWVEAAATHFRGRGYEYTLGIGVHFELKYGGWFGYERAAVEKFRAWLTQRYDGDIAALNRAWGTEYSDFADVVPPVPEPTPGPSEDADPDRSIRNADWIRFREHSLTALVERYYRGIRSRDHSAVISSPLGESFRGQSAEFGNQDIAGLGRSGDNVVFSYDFFIGGGFDSLWNVAAMVRTYRDVAERPVRVEIDGPGVYDAHGGEYIYQAGVRAIESGASGLNVANYTYEREWIEDLSQFEAFVRLGEYIRSARPKPPKERSQVLFYVSTWTQYMYRSPVEWLHRYQFGLLSTLLDQDVDVRVVTDANLLRAPARHWCARHDVLVLPYAVVIDEPVREHLDRLLRCMPALQDMRLGDAVPDGSGDAMSTRYFGVRRDGVADPLEGRVLTRRVLRSFRPGDTVRLQGLGQPTPSQALYVPVTDDVQAQLESSDGRLLWARDGRIRRATLGYNVGEVYAQGGYKNQTCAVVLDTLRWLGAPTRPCEPVPDIDPPIYDFARSAAEARTGVHVRAAGLESGAGFDAVDGALEVRPPTESETGGRVLADYPLRVPEGGARFSAGATVGADSGPVVLSLVAVRPGGAPEHLVTTTVRASTPAEVTADLAALAGEQVSLRLALSGADVDGARTGLVRLTAPVVVDGQGEVVLDLVADADAAGLTTERSRRGLAGGAQFFSTSVSSIKVHPPFSDGTGATSASYAVRLPDEATRFEAVVRKEASGGDGVWFSVALLDERGDLHEPALRHLASTTETAVSVDVSAFAGQQVDVVLRVDAGPASDPSYDATLVRDARIVA